MIGWSTVDLQNRLLTIYRDRAGEIYRYVRATAMLGVVALSQLPNTSVNLNSLFV